MAITARASLTPSTDAFHIVTNRGVGDAIRATLTRDEARRVAADLIELLNEPVTALRSRPALGPQQDEEQRPPSKYHWGEEMTTYATLGIGARAWAELIDIEDRGTKQRNNDRSGMMMSWGTFTLPMKVLRAIRVEDFSSVSALRGAAPETPEKDTSTKILRAAISELE